jgi:hypothetical protein
VETPREGSIFEVEEICLVKIQPQSMNLVFANLRQDRRQRTLENVLASNRAPET